MLANLSLRNRLLFGYSVPILLFVVLGGVNFFSTYKKQALEEQNITIRKITRAVNEVALGGSRMVRNVRGQVLFPADDSYLASYQKGLGIFREAGTELKEIVKDSQLLEQVNILSNWSEQ